MTFRDLLGGIDVVLLILALLAASTPSGRAGVRKYFADLFSSRTVWGRVWPVLFLVALLGGGLLVARFALEASWGLSLVYAPALAALGLAALLVMIAFG